MKLPSYIQSPMIQSRSMSEMLQKDVFLKLENLQPTGSFKDRGIGHLCGYYHHENDKGFVASSGGNAGLAMAYAAKRLHKPATVIIPKTTPTHMIQKMELFGAKVIVHGDNWNEADDLARTMVDKEQLNYVSPFNHPMIWQGYEPMIDEINAQIGEPDAMIMSVGGGGLFTGLMQGMIKHDWNKVKIITGETQGANALAKSLSEKQRITMDKIDSIATTLGAKQVLEQAFAYAIEKEVVPHVCTDAEAVSSIVQFADATKMIVEPACGAALSPIYHKPELLDDYQKIVIIVCGGSGVNIDLIGQWVDTYKLPR